MMPREGRVQSRAAAHGLRVMLSGWGGDEAISARMNGGLSEFFVRRQWEELRSVAGFRLEVADGPGISKALLRIKRIGGIVRDIIVPRLPDSLFVLFFHDIWLRSNKNCAQPSFLQAHRQAVKTLRGPAFRARPEIRATICHRLEYGHIVKRMEHWAVSGARQRLVYRYPLLDRRLVEFALGIPTIQHCRTRSRLPIFRRSISELMPTTCDWDQRKTEASTLGAQTEAWFSAHEEWARRLLPSPSSPRFVDPEMIRKVVLGHGRRDKMDALSGVRQAFACYAVGELPFVSDNGQIGVVPWAETNS